MKHVFVDCVKYAQSLQTFFDHSNEHESLFNFINTMVPEIISSIGNRTIPLHILGVGSGSGELDLEILSKIKEEKPDTPILNEVLEPNSEQIKLFKERIANAPNFKNVKFMWHPKTTEEYKQDVKIDNGLRKFDLIHMIQMIYYVKDPYATVKFFMSCLAPKGKLVIILLSRDSHWNALYRKHESLLQPNEGFTLDLHSEDIINVLDSMSAKYQTYKIPSEVDITECFLEGSKNVKGVLDILTEIHDFTNTAPPELKEQIMSDLRSPEFSFENDGRIFVTTDLVAIVAENR
ncbi:histamine N-methyltransferase [Bombina bombina]|uniref:histamine N-methyltransferase n=1 Tax=Bombina bombina TaxID=8345 RepID=UPI00235B0B86|nr:histamine N-methyltransferase [Bombina bombina]XP_053554232.1 histamine N-methyltransferase [Bombina bombina]